MRNRWISPDIIYEITLGHIKTKPDQYQDALGLRHSETNLDSEFSALMQFKSTRNH